MCTRRFVEASSRPSGEGSTSASIVATWPRGSVGARPGLLTSVRRPGIVVGFSEPAWRRGLRDAFANRLGAHWAGMRKRWTVECAGLQIEAGTPRLPDYPFG